MNSFARKLLLGGMVSAAVMGAGTFIPGEISSYKAKDLLGTSPSGINLWCNTVIPGSSTILALMLTLLSISRAANSKPDFIIIKKDYPKSNFIKRS